MNFKLIFILILIGLAVLFGVQNVAVVEIQFLVWSFSIARSILIFFALATGIILGWLLHSLRTIGKNIRSGPHLPGQAE